MTFDLKNVDVNSALIESEVRELKLCLERIANYAEALKRAADNARTLLKD